MNRIASWGFVWICSWCGARSRDEYGDDPIDDGDYYAEYTDGCAEFAHLVHESSIVWHAVHFNEDGAPARYPLSAIDAETGVAFEIEENAT
jgi:hypothetical protein